MKPRMVRAVASTSALAVGLVPQLPWVTTGARSRNSYEVFRSAQALGVDELTPLRVAWFLVPVLALGVVGWIAVGRLRLAAGFLAVAALLVAGVAVVVVAAGLAAPGAWVALVVGVAALVASALLVPRGSSDPRAVSIREP